VDLRATRHTVRGDSTRLQQIFWNLINNAQKFTPAQGQITVRSFDAADGMVRVEVTDHRRRHRCGRAAEAVQRV
jgi:signal transduction histidine kinase